MKQINNKNNKTSKQTKMDLKERGNHIEYKNGVGRIREGNREKNDHYALHTYMKTSCSNESHYYI